MMEIPEGINAELLVSSREKFQREFLTTERHLEQTQKLLHLADRTKVFHAMLMEDPKAKTLITQKRSAEDHVKTAPAEEGEAREQEVKTASLQLLTHLKDEHHYLFDLVANLRLDDDQRVILEQSIADIAYSYVNNMQSLAPDKKRFKQEAVEQTVQALIKESSSFSLLKKTVLPEDEKTAAAEEPLSIEEVRSLEDKLMTKMAILSLDPQLEAYAHRRWIGKQKRSGEKVYLTPYYQAILSLSQRLERKENGIGGRIYFGPPGTGKTELGIRANKEAGYKTHVINLHEHIVFMHLIGQQSIPIGLDTAASLMQRIKGARELIETWSADQFWQRSAELARNTGQEPLQLLGRFLDELPAPGQELTSEQKQEMHEAYLAYLDRQALAASMGEKTPNMPAEKAWVNGEILNAIERHEKVYFTEIDKAGPHALDGILHFLTRSPGEEITFGDKTVRIPSWFSIDGDCNLLELGGEKESLYNRFNEVFIGYPPLKDEAMIASVWLSDGEGNITLDPYEQWQMIGFLTYILPEIRVLYEHSGEKKLDQPFSLRNLKELCNLLVDPKTKERTDLSVGRAIEMALLEIRTFASSGEGKKILRQVLTKHHRVLAEPVEELGAEKIDADQTRLERKQARLTALAKTVSEPMTRTAVMLPEETAEITRNIKFQHQKLTPEEMTAIPDFLETKSTPDGRPQEWVSLDNGQHFTLDQSDKYTYLTLNVQSKDDELVELTRLNVGKREEELKLIDVSRNGQVALFEGVKEDKRYVYISGLGQEFVRPDGSIYKRTIHPALSPESALFLSPSENWLAEFQSKKGDLKLYNPFENQGVTINTKAKRFEFTPDGRVLLVETFDNETWLIDLHTVASQGLNSVNRPKSRLKQGNWHVVSEDLIVNPTTSEAVLIKKE
ncbi:hypothetical protein ISS85_04425 [Candidatus Microgenomates bacterium]|nr:hypothetical protein [Candidatus Microgenomates bacterium]